MLTFKTLSAIARRIRLALRRKPPEPSATVENDAVLSEVSQRFDAADEDAVALKLRDAIDARSSRSAFRSARANLLSDVRERSTRARDSQAASRDSFEREDES